MNSEPSQQQVAPPLPVAGLSHALAAQPGPIVPKEAQERITAALRASKSESTARNYRSDWDRFVAWCVARDYQPLPAAPEVLADYLTEHAAAITEEGTRAFAIATLARWTASVNYFHRATGHTPPGSAQLVKDTMSGLKRMYARTLPRPPKKKDPLLLDPLRDIVRIARKDATTWRKKLRERRDSAILLLGFAGALRRSEIVALSIGDLTEHTEPGADGIPILVGMTMNVRISKTDQEGKGMLKAIPIGEHLDSCAPCAYIRWVKALVAYDRRGRAGVIRELSGDDVPTRHVCRDGLDHIGVQDATAPLIRAMTTAGLVRDTAPDDAVVHHVVQTRAAAAGWDPGAVKLLGGHSLRAGTVTESFNKGQSAHAIMQQTGHKSGASVEGYARHKNAWEHNAVTEIGM